MPMATPTVECGTTAGIVLAGGLSSRMGRDKAQLPWQGRTLLTHMRALLASAGADPVRISGNHPDMGGVPDLVPRCGPLGGLYSVVTTLEDGPAWVVPVDMPYLDVHLLWQLRAATSATCTVFAEYPLPMLLHINPFSRQLLAEMLADPYGPRSLRSLQRRLGAVELALPADAAACLFNCNTPEQWKEIAR
ncbi:molybdenum cofactor guanylyltransferase [Stenotrophomonas sp. SY1]|uniref:molybdenum cofactor guanylyltransferase n=1 Tax=Stenotrophomonas sp. SY1 TaxID=477235 RepID=UPI001E3A6F62|nr:molybdenum cofactor guanylyltransferase [Stenotrophomonas sp. SY1]